MLTTLAALSCVMRSWTAGPSGRVRLNTNGQIGSVPKMLCPLTVSHRPTPSRLATCAAKQPCDIRMQIADYLCEIRM